MKTPRTRPSVAITARRWGLGLLAILFSFSGWSRPIGPSHHLTACASGAVWGWGLNDLGQLGIDPDAQFTFPTPQQIVGLNNIVMTAPGSGSSYALTGTGASPRRAASPAMPT